MNDISHAAVPVGGDLTDTVLHLVAKIASAISFPVGNAEFDAVLDDCIAALEGAPSPAEDRARAERALRALLDQVDKLGLAVPEDLRNESLKIMVNFSSFPPITSASQHWISKQPASTEELKQ